MRVTAEMVAEAMEQNGLELMVEFYEKNVDRLGLKQVLEEADIIEVMHQALKEEKVYDMFVEWASRITYYRLESQARDNDG